MTERLIDFLLKLAPRERWLIAVLVAFVLPVSLIFGWLLPLAEERREAMRILAEAQALDVWVRERQMEMTALALPVVDPELIGPEIGASGLEQSLVARRLRANLSALETREQGEILLRFTNVNFVDLMRWVDAEDPAWGYRISALRIDRTARPALVDARLALVPASQQ